MGQPPSCPSPIVAAQAPAAQLDSFRSTRPSIVGPDCPEDPYPIQLEGTVQHGFGRGNKELGCPTANLPDESTAHMASIAKPGVYYGYARVYPVNDQQAKLPAEDSVVLPIVMSLGWNLFYKNERMTAEIHIMHQFSSNFYEYGLKVLVLGYIRPELDYTSLEALLDDIEIDKRVALNSVARPGYARYTLDPFLRLEA